MAFASMSRRSSFGICAALISGLALAACNGQSSTSESGQSASEKKPVADKSNTLVMQLKTGTVTIPLRPDLAPNHVKRVTTLANQGFYDGLKFHRVIEGFMAQTGDPKGDGTGGSSLPDLNAEFSNRSFTRGVVGMARAQSPNSANSQFFIMLQGANHLDGKYTVFGKVSEGMEFVDQIKKGASDQNGKVADPDTIIKMRTADKF